MEENCGEVKQGRGGERVHRETPLRERRGAGPGAKRRRDMDQSVIPVALTDRLM